MSVETVLAIVLGLALACNGVLVAAFIRRSPRRSAGEARSTQSGSSSRDDEGSPSGDDSAEGVADVRADADADAAAEAALSTPSGARESPHAPIILSHEDVEPVLGREGSPGAWASPSARGSPSVGGPPRSPGSPGSLGVPASPAFRPGTSRRGDAVDAASRLGGPSAWERWMADESARVVRYSRPVAIVVGELVGLRRLEDRFGQQQASSVVSAVADVFDREARSCDRVARLGGARFAVLLPETDEQQAANYAERVRGASDRWLEAGGLAVRLSIGIASPGPSGRLDTALRIAEERMYASTREGGRDKGG